MYGDMRQWKRRVERRLSKGRKMQIGVSCPDCQAREYACGPCADLQEGWGDLLNEPFGSVARSVGNTTLAQEAAVR